MAKYQIIEDFPTRILFYRKRSAPIQQTAAFSAIAIFCLIAALISKNKNPPDSLGFWFFVTTGAILLIAAIFSFLITVEIEFNSPQKGILKRVRVLQQVVFISTLPYSDATLQMGTYHHGDFDTSYVKIKRGDRVWAALTGYPNPNQADVLRLKLKQFMESEA